MLFMTPNIIRNLLAGRATRNYPFEVREPFTLARGELVNEIEKCIFCGMCQRKCPSQCITVDKDTGTWECDPFACVYCGVCVDTCPVHCLSQKQLHRHVSPEREIITLKGTPPKPKKKAKKAEEKAEQ